MELLRQVEATAARLDDPDSKGRVSRRRARRCPCTLPALVGVRNATTGKWLWKTAMMVDLSMRGCRLLCSLRTTDDQILGICFPVSHDNLTVNTGMVISSIPSSRSGAEAGVREIGIEWTGRTRVPTRSRSLRAN
ncbi:MAG: hypothetical protein QM770_08315 [Tepidisphaeraceae bacterium]